MTTVKELLERHDFFDEAIIRHGFTDYMRDYEIVVWFSQMHGNDIKKFQFVGCVEAAYSLQPSPFWAQSLADEFVLANLELPLEDLPPGFIWAVRYADVYPGWTYVEDGERAASWSKLLGRKMHEIDIETNVFKLKLVFADVRIAVLDLKSEAPLRQDYPLPVNDRTSDGGIT